MKRPREVRSLGSDLPLSPSDVPSSPTNDADDRATSAESARDARIERLRRDPSMRLIASFDAASSAICPRAAVTEFGSHLRTALASLAVAARSSPSGASAISSITRDDGHVVFGVDSSSRGLLVVANRRAQLSQVVARVRAALDDDAVERRPRVLELDRRPIDAEL